jgi:metallo-beta-lactamase family protein
MKLTFLGGTGTVTGSKYLVESSGKKILVDCGLFQGMKELRLRNWNPLPIDPSTVDAVVLTHAHIDHTGYLPRFVKDGFNKKIYCSPATQDLCKVLLPDSAHLQEEDAEHANRKGTSKHRPALPLYDGKDAERALQHFKPVAYDTDFAIADGINCRLTPSGHILGSAFVTLTDKKTSIVFSGDLGRPNDLIMLPPRWIKSTDYLVLESTYGGREHPTTGVLDQLEAVINRTVKRKGVVLIPAFAVGRAQTILHAIYLLKQSRRMPENIPVYLNSPMSISATNIFCTYSSEHRLSAEQCKSTCETAQYVSTVNESKELNEKTGPMIIISASGMLTGGRILHHIKAFGPSKENTILLTGFQGAGTRGARLMAGEKTLKIYGEQVQIEAEVANIGNLSAHADQREILDWLSHFQKPPKTTFLTHGEPKGAASLKEAVEKKLTWNCEIPEYLKSVELA